MFTITVSEEMHDACPEFVGVALYAEITNSLFNEGLWEEIGLFSQVFTSSFTIEEVKQHAVIAATRQAYKRCGKDPNRYRPSAEALRRRLLRGIELYRIDTLVDLINLTSLSTGFSIGGFDADRIAGTTLKLGIGRANEPFEGIGRGVLNIEGLPVYRDAQGGIGTPTSDHERTKIGLTTTRTLVLINGFGGREGLTEAMEMIKSLMQKYAAATNVTGFFYE